ncbi:OmpP1/FadL family transporter [Methylovirgula sp. 4M-Z18]|uniref:OmpP1/FadL family transporter n=1 Tax=Methylovirgula sp. 4M-Z18 TaxID=2293567 RepID=UPI000E2F2CC1|nr:outer membrane protein transport protein [Methylovirgula sp. 4M-Z18]RFB80979.1 transporter [Methylovirgula sp. 4M-Z18]
MAGSFKSFLLVGAGTIALAVAASSAQAGSFGLHEQGAAGTGVSYAGVAAGSAGLSSMFWNPATITDNPGLQSSISLSGIFPYASVTPSAKTVSGLGPGASTAGSNVARDGYLPASYSSYQFNDSFWFGLATNTPFGLTTKGGPNWAGQLYGRTSKVRSEDFSPTIGWKINDMISVAVGLQIERFSVRLTQALGTTYGAPSVDLNGHSWGVGATAGVTLKPFDGTEIGIGYRSQVKQDLKGSIKGFPFFLIGAPVGIADASVKSNVTLPDEVTLGLRQRITNDFTALAGFDWTHWKLFNSFPVTIANSQFASVPNGTTLTTLGFRYNNSWLASIGGEYRWNDQLKLRAGLGYEKSPIDDAVRSVRLPDVDRLWTSIGASYAVNNKLSLDVSYAHAFKAGGAKINIGPGNPAYLITFLPTFQGETKAHLDIVAVGLTYRWDDPKVVTGVAPKTAKY